MTDRVLLLRVIRFGASVLCLLLVGLAFVRTHLTLAAALPVYWTIPPYQLQDQRGQRFGSAQLRGKVILANLIYTRCTDICPAVLEPKMEAVQRDAQAGGLLGSKLELLSLTADPAHDTPSVLAAFAQKFDANPAAWHFLTGNPQTVQELIYHGFKLDVEPTANPDQIVHDAHFLLIDRRARVRGVYDGLDTTPAQLYHDARALVSSGGD